MKYLLISGDHPRHLHYANNIIQNCDVVGVIVQKREHFIPVACSNLNKIDRENFIKHFDNREFYEKEYFGLESNIKHKNVHCIDNNALSSNSTIDFVRKIKPDVCFIFGCGMIKDPLFSFLPDLKINLHLGLSPRYRGSATLFWPFYFLEPNWAGSTFHIISNEPDAGDIIHQASPVLELGDTIHQVACKVVKKSAEDVLLIINKLEQDGKLTLIQQTSTGKNFLSKDFIPEHLRIIYNVFNDNIVDYYLNNELSKKKVKLINMEKAI